MALIPIEDLERATPLFRGRAGHAFAGWLMRRLNVDKIEAHAEALKDFHGPEFAQKVLEAAGMSYSVNGLPADEAAAHFREILPSGPFITISNHTMGAMDGISLIDFIGHVRADYKYMVNELLWRVEPLRESLIPVTPNGATVGAPTAQSISGVRAAKEHLASGGCLGLFPSGAVSDLKPFQSRPVAEIAGFPPHREPRVRDREWQMSIIKFIRTAGVPVLPLRLMDGNSRFYYSLGLIDWRLRLLRLPSELLNKSGKTLRILAGPVIEPSRIANFSDLQDLRSFLRSSVYSLK